MRAPDTFGRLLAAGITSWFGLQAIVNLGAVTGLLPITGVPLPVRVVRRHRALVVTLACGRRARVSIARAGGGGSGTRRALAGRRPGEGRDRRRAARRATCSRRSRSRRSSSRRGTRSRSSARPAGRRPSWCRRPGSTFMAVEAAPLAAQRLAEGVAAPVVGAALRHGACRPLVAGADVGRRDGRVRERPPVAGRAARAHRPVVLHEQNAVPGLANRLLARAAPDGGAVVRGRAPRRLRAGARTVLTGNPVAPTSWRCRRAATRCAKEARAAFDLDEDRRRSWCSAGASGALHVDRASPRRSRICGIGTTCSCSCSPAPAPRGSCAAPRRASMSLRVRPLPFLDRMELAYAAADAVVARAGATSIAELTVCGLPSLLIPYPHATADHQEANARELERAGAAEVLARRRPAGGRSRGRGSRASPTTRPPPAMGERAAAWARPDAAARLAALVVDVAS